MMKNKFNYLWASMLTLCMCSCVPQKLLEDEQAKHKSCETELSALKTADQNCEAKLAEANRMLAECQKDVTNLKKDSANIGSDYRTMSAKYDKLNQINDQLLDKYNRLLEGNISDTKKISKELQDTQNQLLKQEDDLKDQQKKLDALNEALKQREARVAELESVLKNKDDASNDLKKKLSDALFNFEGKGLTVTQKNGKVYVSMDESLLFASGSIKVEDKGEEALIKVAKVLEQNADINILVEGHTDDVPMTGKGEIKDNWDLSVMRATSIVKILVKNSAIDPKRLTAAGCGEYFPIDPAKTAEARRKNRRTEIILTPKLDALFKVLETK